MKKIKLTSQRIVLAKISNKLPFLKVGLMGAYSRRCLFDNFPNILSAYSSEALIRGGVYSKIYGILYSQLKSHG